MRQTSFDEFERTGRFSRSLNASLPYGIGALLLLALAYFIYTQMNGVTGIRFETPPPDMVNIVPPPPPPPPPPEEVKKPEEPTEKPAPTPSNDSPKADKPAPAPVTMNAPAQAGEGPVASGSGAGNGAPSSKGTCIVNCGTDDGGGGMSEGVYRRLLSNALQQAVYNDDSLNRLAFTADMTLTVTPEGRVIGVRLSRASGRSDRETMQRLMATLERVRGLDRPPSDMKFPYKIAVHGKRNF